MKQIETFQELLNNVEFPTLDSPGEEMATVKNSTRKQSQPAKASVLNDIEKPIKKQMKATTAKAYVASVLKLTTEEAAAEKKRISEGNKLMKIYSSVIVPTWFGQANVAKTINNPKIGPETALCLVYIGVCGAIGNSRTGIQINLRPSGFDRNEAWLFAEMGCSSLIGSKLAKFAKEPKDEQESQLNNLVLTKKGQDLFALIKRVGLQAPGKGLLTQGGSK